jgi:2'-5' RNA ligase
MRWFFIISHKGAVLQNAAQLEVAREALDRHFRNAACSPYEAAHAAFVQEGEQDDADAINADWAEAWRRADGAVAAALGFDERDVTVELQFEKHPPGQAAASASRRLFIGLMVAANFRKAIEDHRLTWQWPSGVRLVPAENLHLTLHFLGDVSEGDEARLRAALATVTMSPLDLTLVKPDVLEQGIAILRPQENEALRRLHAELRREIEGAGLPTDARKWQPHVTLARKAAGATPPMQPASMEWTARQFALVWSKGGNYQVVQAWPEGA